MKIFLVPLAVLAVASPAAAVVISDTFGHGTDNADTPDALSILLGADDAFAGVVALHSSAGNFCSGALISSTSILTARHCTDMAAAADWTVYFGTASTGFLSFSVDAITAIAPDPLRPEEYFNGTDLSVMTLSAAVSGIAPFEVLSETALDETVAIVGYGRSGTGSQGDVNPIDWERRFATNTFDAWAHGRDGNAMLWADFDKADGTEDILGDRGFSSSATGTPQEGLIGSGDSGGPLLFQRDGEWVIGGVATGVRAYDGDSTDSDYGDIGVWTGLHSDAAQDLITDAGGRIYGVPYDPSPTAVPLPASDVALLASLGSLWALRMRRRQTHSA